MTPAIILAFLLGCTAESAPSTYRSGTDPAATGPARIDELAWVQEVRQRRPDLFEKDCFNTLTLSPWYRAELLDSGSTYRDLEAKYFTTEQRRTDRKWTIEQQQAEVAHCDGAGRAGGCASVCVHPCDQCPSAWTGAARGTGALLREPFLASGYPLCKAVGYTVDSSGQRSLYDKSGVVESWKVFFDFNAGFPELVSAASYQEFTRKLAAAGFDGDSKLVTTTSDPGRVRFSYNDVIVHARSPADGLLAEEVGLAHFAGVLDGYGRGLDVGSAPNARDSTDWHHFLCKGSLAGLPEEALSYVRFEPLASPESPTPFSEYKEEMAGFARLLWHPGFGGKEPLREKVRAALLDDMRDLVAQVPQTTIGALRGVTVAVNVSSTRNELEYRGRGLASYASSGWVKRRYGSEERFGSIEILDAEDYLRAREKQSVLVHYLTYVLHLRTSEEVRSTLDAAYLRAVASGDYDNRSPTGGRAWAMRRTADYAAELSEAFWGRSDNLPQDRAELTQVDPEGCQAVATLWGAECLGALPTSSFP